MSENILKKSVVFVDKPKGMTSFDVVEKVREILSVRKAGHTGTLDPNVTGLMMIALEEARKAVPVLMGLDKEYIGKMWLHKDVEMNDLKQAFKKFTGVIKQLPPVKSRVARVERERKIYEFEILGKNRREVEFRVFCEAGTYIRKLVHDLGVYLGVGAHMTWLRRTKIGPFSIDESVKLDELTPEHAIRLEDVLKRLNFKNVVVKNEVVQKIRNGSPVFPEWIIEKNYEGNEKYIGIYNEEREIIALGKPMGDKIKTDRVFLI